MSSPSARPLIIATVVAGVSLLVTFAILMKVFTSARPEATEPALRGGTIDASPSAVPVLFKLPDFELIERNGRAFGTSDLRGKAWIADFVFTSCAGPCPRMTAQMATLQRDLIGKPAWEQTRLVTFSVDPERDTPDVLTTYADTFKADPKNWLFLTGKRPEMWSLITNGFKLHVSDALDDTQMPILHSEKFVLVDRTGRVRGMYDALESEDRERLMKDLAAVLAEPMSDSAPTTQPAE